LFIFNCKNNKNNKNKNDYIGDWGLGIGDWGLGIGPNPQSPIPNPQSPLSKDPYVLKYIILYLNITLNKMDREKKAIIKNSDMLEDMQQDAVNVATKAIETYSIEKDIACFIKKEFDRKHNPTWHCIVGRNFGSYVTHETKHFIYFYLGQIAILLFKSG